MDPLALLCEWRRIIALLVSTLEETSRRGQTRGERVPIHKPQRKESVRFNASATVSVSADALVAALHYCLVACSIPPLLLSRLLDTLQEAHRLEAATHRWADEVVQRWCVQEGLLLRVEVEDGGMPVSWQTSDAGEDYTVVTLEVCLAFFASCGVGNPTS
jgi:hypothetical protein